MTRRPKRLKASRGPPAKRRNATLKARHDPLDDFIAAGARSLDLTIDKAWMLAVRLHLKVTLAHGRRVADVALPDDAEPAPVFKA